ncbi:MAG: hypothetical protein MUP47_00450 [Phycisphaerae bacterium]|nr:hypothetical protein [Phycisphaerae bacterium]
MKTAQASPAKSPARWGRLHPHGTAAAVLGVLVLVIFADVLLDSRPRVLGRQWSDTYKQFAYWRQFGFAELAAGNLALWNPHIFCGCPFFGGAQSALLYPPNWLFVFCPLVTALNLSFVLHLWLTGVFMYAWAFYRGLGTAAATVAGAVLMLSGAVFMQVMPGHLPHLCTLAWAPLVLLAVDGLIDRPGLGWALLGALAVAMQVLAGHPQYFFYTAVTAGLYGALNLVFRARRRWVSVGGIAAMFLGAAALAAVQLLTTLSESAETLRSGGMALDKAAQYSFPPENFVCFLAPMMFGGTEEMTYWGRWFLWEVQPFIGIAGLFLAVYAVLAAPAEKRRFSVLIVAVALVLAMGAYIPALFRLTHDYVPGFDHFRNSSRFLYPATLFLAMLCGLGLQALVSRGRFVLGSVAIVLILALALAVAGVVMYLGGLSPEGEGTAWHNILAAMRRTGESWQPKAIFSDPDFMRQAGTFAAESLWIAAGTAVALALVLFLARLWPRAGFLVAGLAMVELIVFARFTQRPTFQLGAGLPQALQPYVQGRGDDTRTLNPFLPNLAMAVDGADLWGYDSFVLRRYMQFIYFTQGWPIEDADFFQHVGALRPHGLFAMLRCRCVLLPDGLVAVEPMGRLHLVGSFQVCPSREAVFDAMSATDFDPRATVILERPPAIAPAGVPDPGRARVVQSSTDAMTIEAELSAPAILLVTDAYSKSWRARALPGSSQREYTVMPANYCLRAIPLGAGRHRICLEYRPSGFLIGRWVSLVAVAVTLAVLVLHLVRRRAWGGRGKPAAQGAVTYVNPRKVPRS